MKRELPYKAPDFILKDSEGKPHTLSDYAGKWVVLYFYPKDDTPGCTVEACGFRDLNEALLANKACVVGVSPDEADAHDKFTAKYSLNFTLLSDPNHKAMSAYGAWGKKMFGREGVLRKTFIIDPNGQIVKVYAKVTPIGHAKQVLDDIVAFQSAASTRL